MFFFLYERLYSLFDVCFDPVASVASVSLGEGRFSGQCDCILCLLIVACELAVGSMRVFYVWTNVC